MTAIVAASAVVRGFDLIPTRRKSNVHIEVVPTGDRANIGSGEFPTDPIGNVFCIVIRERVVFSGEKIIIGIFSCVARVTESEIAFSSGAELGCRSRIVWRLV